jgi:hypothetical protein
MQGQILASGDKKHVMAQRSISSTFQARSYSTTERQTAFSNAQAADQQSFEEFMQSTASTLNNVQRPTAGQARDRMPELSKAYRQRGWPSNLDTLHALSPDGSLLASGSTDAPWLWDPVSGKPIAKLGGGQANVLVYFHLSFD